MRMMRKLRELLLITIALFSAYIFVVKATEVQAVPSTSDVYKAAPNGINLDDFFEYPASYSGLKGGSTYNVSNPVKILKAGNSTYNNPNDIIQMTNGLQYVLGEKQNNNQVASIWGRMTNPSDSSKDYNYFDLSKNQHVSGWIYVGDTYDASGDGIALVLQNDNNGINAISRYISQTGILIVKKTSFASGRESLGVWGAGGDPSLLTGNVIHPGAIQNSFALEFDAFRNETKSDFSNTLDNFFDGQLDSTDVFEAKGEHVAWNYPGEESTYQQYIPATFYYFGMHHRDSIHNVTIGGYDDTTNATGKDAWHHFSFDYKPDPDNSRYGYISYVYNDRENDGTVKPYNTWDKRPNKVGQTIQIDRSKFNLPSGQNKIRWGFTASTGSPGSTDGYNAVVLESIPAVADVTTTSSLYDNTQRRDIKDYDKRQDYSYPDSDYTVTDGDSLTFKYALKYNSGLKGTGLITTEMQLPQSVDYQADADGNIGKITYKDSGKVTYITADSLKDGTNKDGQAVKTVALTLDSLNDDDANVVIEINGTAIGPVSSTLTTKTVDSEHTSYKSDFYSNDVMSYSFKISNEKLNITPTNNSTTLTVKKDESIDLEGTSNYLMGSTFDGKDLSAHAIIYDKDGNKSKTEGVWTVSSTSGSKTGSYKLNLPSDLLTDGENKVEVYLVDSSGRVSNTATYTVDLKARELDLTPDKETIAVTDNKPVQVSGIYAYKDGLDFQSDTVTLTYQVTNEDGTVHKLPDVTDKSDGKFSIDLNPIAYSKPKTQDIDDYLKDPKADDVLKEGKNVVTITVKDGTQTATGTVTINVPTIKPILTPTQNDVSVIGDDEITFPATFEYPDNLDYELNSGDLTGKAIVDNGTTKIFATSLPTETTQTPTEFNFIVEPSDLGIDTSTKNHIVSVSFSDPYARKTAAVSYNLDILQKVLQLNYSTKSSFKDIKPLQTGFIGRNDDWELSVRSYKSRWTLSANGDNLDRKNSNGTTDLSDLSMYFVGEDDNPISLEKNPQIAASDNMGNVLTQISSSWDADEGILLRAPQPQLSGQYSGKITWNLVDSDS